MPQPIFNLECPKLTVTQTDNGATEIECPFFLMETSEGKMQLKDLTLSFPKRNDPPWCVPTDFPDKCPAVEVILERIDNLTSFRVQPYTLSGTTQWHKRRYVGVAGVMRGDRAGSTLQLTPPHDDPVAVVAMLQAILLMQTVGVFFSRGTIGAREFCGLYLT